MRIKRIAVSDFKSFANLTLDLSDFNVVIGANASGKTNLAQLFKFLSDISKHQLSNAVSMQAGFEYLRNARMPRESDFTLQVVFDLSDRRPSRLPWDEGTMQVRLLEGDYSFALRPGRSKSFFSVSEERLSLKCELTPEEALEQADQRREAVTHGELVLVRRDGRLVRKVSPKALEEEVDSLLPDFLTKVDIPDRALLLETPFFVPVPPFGKLFHDIAVYNIDPRLPKRGVPISGTAGLEEDGSNLAFVLRRILTNARSRDMYYGLLKDVLPFVDRIRSTTLKDKSVFFVARETYAPERYFPASALSDGTIHIAALIVALYFESKPLIVIEEPERNIHPALFEGIVDMMMEASQRKQIIVTTHSPEFLANVDLQHILLLSRDEEGFSRVSRPSEKEHVRIFLDSEIGIRDLFVKDLLGE